MNRSNLAKFLKDQRGASMVFVAVSMFTLIVATGAAVDMGRAQLLKTNMQQCLDAAALAVGSKASAAADLDLEAKKYFEVNCPPGRMGSRITLAPVENPNGDFSLVKLDATGAIDTTFMNVAGIRDMKVNVHSEVTRSTEFKKGLELVMVLDNTGSMNGAPLAALKTSAHTLVDTLYGDKDVLNNTYVSLVPFSSMVNVLPFAANMMPGAPRDWTGCAMPRLRDQTTDAPPSQSPFPPDTGNFVYPPGNVYSQTCGGSHPLHPIQPLMSNKGLIHRQIDAMKANNATQIQVGALWGWGLLSPKWKGLWGLPDWPKPYDPNDITKVLILMTDGANGAKVSETEFAVDDAANQALTQLCANMNQENIAIFSIYYDGNDPLTAEQEAGIKDILRGCATTPAHFFDAPTGDKLTKAFKQIGDSLFQLRLTR